MLLIETRLNPCEIMGEEIKGLPNDADQVLIKSHWNMNCWVVIDFHGRNITVDAGELQKAIQNAINH